ncbi:hypothetical protein R1sor_025608 [Riccia sorocarpa]|uniref:Uncharacterized protein n=1 Tax=Riccia sorocarpa TaxID=122646 RepID=A0ABD3G957_9MARC
MDSSSYRESAEEEEVSLTSDEDEICDDSDEEEIYEKSLEALRTGKVYVKNTDDETLRCPYSPGRMKQSYRYRDLLQHATALGRGNRTSLEVGRHAALAEYLRTDLASMAPQRVERVRQFEIPVPNEEDWKELLLFPWTGLVYNLPKEVNERGVQVGPSNEEMRLVFRAFSPEKAETVRAETEHLGLGVVTFRRDFEGWKRAKAFERWFIRKQRGKEDWRSRTHVDSELYGWLARKEDYEGLGDQDAMASFLKKRRPLELKDIGMIIEDRDSMYEARLNYLLSTVGQRKFDVEKMMRAVQVAGERYDIMIGPSEKATFSKAESAPKSQSQENSLRLIIRKSSEPLNKPQEEEQPVKRQNETNQQQLDNTEGTKLEMAKNEKGVCDTD